MAEMAEQGHCLLWVCWDLLWACIMPGKSGTLLDFPACSPPVNSSCPCCHTRERQFAAPLGA